MDYQYPVNLEGHEEWMHSDYDPKLAQGDVVTKDGIVIGTWRVVDYDPKDDYSPGKYEFIVDGEDTVKFAEPFDMLDVRTSRGFALSNFVRTIRDWYES